MWFADAAAEYIELGEEFFAPSAADMLKELFQNNLYTWFNDIIPFFVRTQVLNVK